MAHASLDAGCMPRFWQQANQEQQQALGAEASRLKLSNFGIWSVCRVNYLSDPAMPDKHQWPIWSSGFRKDQTAFNPPIPEQQRFLMQKPSYLACAGVQARCTRHVTIEFSSFFSSKS